MPNKEESTKKEFDKKKWRLKKYSKEYKIKQWEERRRKAALRKHRKELKKDGGAAVKTDIFSQLSEGDGSEPKIEKKKKLSAFQAAQLEFQRKREEKKQKREDALRREQEKEAALNKYRARKADRFKKLSKKTRKGQPVMKERIELLLDKIQGNSDVYRLF